MSDNMDEPRELPKHEETHIHDGNQWIPLSDLEAQALDWDDPESDESTPEDSADPPYTPTNAELVASAAYTSVPGLTDEESLEAVAEIVYGAPEHLRDDFQICCALYLYRQALIKAVAKNDIGQIVNTQSLILGVISQ